MDYERGLEQLKQLLRGTAWEQEFLVYEARLREILYKDRLYGTRDLNKSDRAQIIDNLNRLAKHVNTNFNDLCLTGTILNLQATPKLNYPAGEDTQRDAPPAISGSSPGSVTPEPNFLASVI